MMIMREILLAIIINSATEVSTPRLNAKKDYPSEEWMELFVDSVIPKLENLIDDVMVEALLKDEA